MKVCPQCGAEYELDQKFCSKDGVTLRNAASNTSLEGQIIADRYQILRQLGEGGMGKVYLAEHVRIKRKSAVKVMKAELITDADAVGRFVREATNASRVDHPNVAAIYDFGETEDGLFYLAMEFVSGQPLREVLQEEGALPPARVSNIIQQTAEALTAAHELGIVHRDLKPDNIMLAKNRDGTDRVKVVDFGISKAVRSQDQQVTVSGILIGTPAYMSPEQISGDPIDGRSDVYALALVAFKMLTGELPFVSETTYELMSSRLTQAPRTLTELKPGASWPDGLQEVLSKALEVSPSKRYASAVEFARDLSKAIEVRRRSMEATALMGGDATEVIGAPGRAATPSIPPTIVASGSGRGKVFAFGGIGAALAAAAVLVVVLNGGGSSSDIDSAASVASSADTTTLAAPTGTGASAEWVGPDGKRPEPRALASGADAGAPVELMAKSQSPPAAEAAGRKAAAVNEGAAARTTPATAPGGGTSSTPVTTAATGAQPPAPNAGAQTASVSAEAPAGPAPVEIISRLRSMVNAQAPVESDLMNAVRESPRMLSAMRSRNDSISILFYRAQALALLGRGPEACGVLNGLVSMSRDTRFAGAVARAHEGLSCQ
jgi:eukaryotic-like serine/threonine-protein kinase